MEEPPYVLENGTEIVIDEYIHPSGVSGVFVKDEYKEARRPGSLGTIRGWVPGCGGDVYWVEHPDGSIAVYGWQEFELSVKLEDKDKESDH